MRFPLLIACIILLPLAATAQTCEGNLGDNIFEDGDFGEGTTNDVQMNPNIAPGYAYTTPGPPQDGFYTVTQNTGQWAGLYGTWLAIQDNSPDPDGYMMVVNASFDEGLFYESEVTGLCENTLYEFSADIINVVKANVANHIKPNVSFLLDGQVQFSTGDIPQNEQWNNYGFTFTTAVGQNSITLSLRNNAPGGIGNDLALDNISFRACGDEAFILPETIANICEDGSALTLDATTVGTLYDNPTFQWQESFDMGMTWQNIAGATGLTYDHTDLASGVYYYRFLLADGINNLDNEKCRVNSNIKLINVVPKEWSLNDTICEGGEFLFGTTPYTETGVYIDTLLNFLGCDSVVTINLQVQEEPDLTATIDATDPSCFDTTDGSIEIVDVQNGAPEYTYTFNDVPVDQQTSFSNLPGDSTYALRITDRFGCFLDLDVPLVQPGELTFELGEDRTVNLGETVDLIPTANFPVATALWSSTDSLPCPSPSDCPELSWTPTRTQTLSVLATDAFGCTISDEVTVRVVPIRPVYAPTGFSPNDDGVNDKFLLNVAEPNVTSILDFRIFDRWGSELFTATNVAPNDTDGGWDGTANGQRMKPGVYVWTATLRFLDGVEIQYSGDVALVR